MRYATSSLGLTVLAIAVAVGVMGDDSKPKKAKKSHPTEAAPFKVNAPASTSSPSFDSSHQERTMEAYTSALTEVETLAEARLEELNTNLYLSQGQLRQLKPLVLQATPGYIENGDYSRYRLPKETKLGSALSRPAFEDRLFALLNAEQQLDYAASVAEREAWWASIISRLEADLEYQTSPSNDLPESPDPLPPTEPGTSANAAPHRSRNLFKSEPE